MGIPCSQFVQEFKRRMLPDYWRAHVFVEAPKYVWEWCDGASSQFKCAAAFADVADSEIELGYGVTRFFYETSHAKGKEAEWVVNVSSYRVVSFNEVC